MIEPPETKRNGCYRRDLKTILKEIGALEVKRIKDSKFHSKLFPYKKR